MQAVSFEVAPLTGSIGAELLGIDLSHVLPDETIQEIRRALVEYGVVFFRDQSLDAEQQKAFARRFGKIFVHPNFAATRADPEVVEVRREPGDLRYVGEIWHTDTTMMACPPMGAVLYGEVIPPFGGDTLFSSQSLAFERLSPRMQQMLRGLDAVHSDRKVAGPEAGRSRNAQATTKLRDDDQWRETLSVHPVVCRHPESGREYLFVNHSYTVAFDGMTEQESAPLLNFLMDHGHRPEFTCRFRWRPGSVAFWDNRSTKHLAVDDAGNHRRVMRRVQISGEKPIASSAMRPAVADKPRRQP
jgi:taurine dioxygenase